MSGRFHVTTVTLLAALVLAAPAAAQFSEPPLLDKPQAGYYRLKIGKVDVIAVSDVGVALDQLCAPAVDPDGTEYVIVPLDALHESLVNPGSRWSDHLMMDEGIPTCATSSP